MSDDENNIFPLTVEISKHGEKHTFQSFEEILSFHSEEMEEFKWLEQEPKFGRIQFNRVRGKMNGLKSNSDRLRAAISQNEKTDGHVENLKNWFQEHLATNQVLCSKTVDYKYVRKLLEVEDPLVVSFAFALACNQDIDPNFVRTCQFQRASNVWFLHDLKVGQETSVIAEREKLNQVFKDANTALQAFSEESKNTNDEIKSIKSKIDSFLQKGEEDLEGIKVGAQEDYNKIDQVYRAHMQLKSPVEYWEEKSSFHRNRSIGYGIASLSGGVVFAVGIVFYVSRTFVNNPPLIKDIVIAVLLTTLSLWLIRSLTKLLFSNLHLNMESHEKAVMAKTFLALVYEDGELSDKEKQLVLTTLFRPSQTGIISEDGSPPGVYDLITRLLSK